MGQIQHLLHLLLRRLGAIQGLLQHYPQKRRMDQLYQPELLLQQQMLGATPPLQEWQMMGATPQLLLPLEKWSLQPSPSHSPPLGAVVHP